MKRLLILLAIAFSIVAHAKTVTFYEPENIYDLVRITGDNVNLRKGPSASSPRLVHALPETEECYIPFAEWSDEAKGKTEPIYGGDFGVCGIHVQLGRNHDYGKYDKIPENEELWIKLAFEWQGDYIPVWVKRNFCDIMPMSNLMPENYNNNSYKRSNLVIRQGGIYDGLCFYDACMISTENDPEGLFIGKLINGKVLLPLRYTGWINRNEDIESIEVGDSAISYPLSCEVRTSSPYGCESLTLDYTKLSDSDISKILEKCEPTTESSEIVLLENTFDGGFIQINLPTDKSTFLGLPINKIIEELPEYKAATPRVVRNPKVSGINRGTKLERVSVQPDGTTLEMSFVNMSGIRQWNVNCEAYVTCDATPGKKYRLLRTRGVNISPKPTYLSGNRNERVSFSMTFEPVPLNASTLTLVEGPSRDNFHVTGIDITERPVLSTEVPISSTEVTAADEPILEVTEEAPEFPGGLSAALLWIGRNMKYPEHAAYKKITGRVVVRFAILKDGSIGEVKVTKSVDPELDAEAVRVVREMPKWNPGKVGGRPVNTWFSVPVTFNIVE